MFSNLPRQSEVHLAVLDACRSQEPEYPGTIDGETDLFTDLGFDSLDILELLMTLEERLGISIDEELLDDVTTVGQLVTYVHDLLRQRQ